MNTGIKKGVTGKPTWMEKQKDNVEESRKQPWLLEPEATD
jgi:hypothetical protein